VRLRLIGGCRDAGDEARLAALRALAASPELALPRGAVEFLVNVPLAQLRAALGGAVAGLHTMWNEHFGIGVVEMMAAGVLTVAHDSGGPRADIVRPLADGTRTGFLATSAAQYADALDAIFRAVDGRPGGVDAVAMAAAARAAVARRFSDEAFARAFAAVMRPAVDDALRRSGGGGSGGAAEAALGGGGGEAKLE